MQNKNLKKAKEWFVVGDREYNFGMLHLNDKESGFYAEMCFMFHQAVEKYLKGYLIAVGIKPPKTHDNGSLCVLCGKNDKSFKELVDDCSILNKHYISTRYPVHFGIATKVDAKKAAQTAEKIIKIINKMIIK